MLAFSEPENHRLPEGDSTGQEDVAKALNSFHGVRNRALRKIIFEILPWSLLTGASASIFLMHETFLMYTSMIIAVVLTFLVFKVVMQSIPEVLGTIWNMNIISDRDSLANMPQSAGEGYWGGSTPLARANLREKFTTFLRDFEDNLNYTPGQVTLGTLFTLILFARSIYKFISWLPEDFSSLLLFRAGGDTALLKGIQLYINVYLTRYPVEQPLKFWTGFILEPVVGFFLGLIVWRMLVTGVEIWKINKTFDLVPHVAHPDKCGGLEPLGNLCLYNALIVSIWGIFLGGWMMLGPFTEYGLFYSPLFYNLLLIPVIIAVITFFLPLWGLHQHMIHEKLKIMRRLDRISQNIDKLENRRLNLADNMEAEAPDLSKDLENLRKVYNDNLNYPEWPFNYRILLAFVTSQAVPLLSLAGLGTPLLNLINSLLGFLNQIGK